MNTKLIFLYFIFFANTLLAAEVIQSKDQRVLIQSDTEKFETGQIYSVYNFEKMKTATIKITVVRKTKAIADLIDGSAVVGQTAKLNQNFSSQSSQKMQVGFGFKSSMNELSVVEKSGAISETVNMNGLNFGFSGFVGYKISESFLLKLILGYETYDIKGSSNLSLCGNSTSKNCFVKSNYLTAGGKIQYNFTNFWINFGGTIKSAVSSESNAVFLDDLKLKGTIDIEIGNQYKLSEKHFIPLSVGYEHSLNTSTEVPKISQINLFIGYGYSF